MGGRNLAARCAFAAAALFTPSLDATELEQMVSFWRKEAPTCSSPSGIIFASGAPTSASAKCEDGDMVLLAGLLCSVGEDIGCVTVRHSQQLALGDDYGRWYRSPRRMETGNDADEDGNVPEDQPEGVDKDGDGRLNEREWNTFSFDMALGVMLFLTARRHDTDDLRRGQLWWNWLHDYTPPVVFPEHALPRFCGHLDCSIRVSPFGNDYAMLAEVGDHLSLTPPDGRFKDLLQADAGRASARIVLDARMNDEGFSEHIVAVSIWLMRAIGRGSSPELDRAAELLNCRKPNIAERLILDPESCEAKEPANAFYRFLRDGPSDAVVDLVLKTCPSNNRPASEPSYWIWESTGAHLSGHRSMYWDCIFMARALGVSG
jgi:hypothetical protein